MNLIVLVLVVLVVLALFGGGYHGYSTGLFAGGGRPLYLGGGLGLVLVIIVVVLLLRGL